MLWFELELDNFEILKKNKKFQNNVEIFNFACKIKKGYAICNHYDSGSSTIAEINQILIVLKKKTLYLKFLNLKKGNNKNTRVRIEALDNFINDLEKLEFIDLVRTEMQKVMIFML